LTGTLYIRARMRNCDKRCRWDPLNRVAPTHLAPGLMGCFSTF
jgi:hypothetical protein